jgi:uncharacterized protein
MICHLRLFILLIILSFFSSLHGLARDNANHKNAITLHINQHAIKAEVARTSDERSKGLMNRKHMAANAGMLFVFEQPQIVSMWMKNTLLPLSVAFIDEQGRIINIAEMKPQTLDTHSSLTPAKYALEMNAGWFDKREILAGKSVEGIEAALLTPSTHQAPAKNPAMSGK